MDDLYWRLQTHELIQFANLMGIDFSDLKRGASFKKKIYKRVKDHSEKFVQLRGHRRLFS